MNCEKHPKEETSLTCGRCEVPICVRCVVHSDVGIRCRGCAPANRVRMRKGASLVGGAVVLLVLFVIGTSLVSGDNPLSSGSQTGQYDEFLDEQLAQYEGVAAVDRLVDPWTPEGTEYQASSGRRLVALEVTVDNPSDGSETVWADADGFKLTDAEKFAYAPTPLRMQTQLPLLELGPGEKASGWVVFEVDEENALKSLSYWSAEVALPH